MAAKPIYPEPWPPKKPRNSCCVGCFMTFARFPKFNFFGNPPVSPGMGLGDDLVTIRVLEPHPPPHSPPSLKTSKKWISSGRRSRGVQTKNSLGDVFIGQNNDLTRV